MSIPAAIVNASRAISAAVAAAAVIRLGWRTEQAYERLLVTLLGAMALLSVLTFYNFGYPQFYDSAQRQPTYVHGFDMRVYFPAVKYFDELGYDGVYLASVKAYADEELGGSLDPIADVHVRDLRDYEMRSVSELAEAASEALAKRPPAKHSPRDWTPRGGAQQATRAAGRDARGRWPASHRRALR